MQLIKKFATQTCCLKHRINGEPKTAKICNLKKQRLHKKNFITLFKKSSLLFKCTPPPPICQVFFQKLISVNFKYFCPLLRFVFCNNKTLCLNTYAITYVFFIYFCYYVFTPPECRFFADLLKNLFFL